MTVSIIVVNHVSDDKGSILNNTTLIFVFQQMNESGSIYCYGCYGIIHAPCTTSHKATFMSSYSKCTFKTQGKSQKSKIGISVVPQKIVVS